MMQIHMETFDFHIYKYSHFVKSLTSLESQKLKTRHNTISIIEIYFHIGEVVSIYATLNKPLFNTA